MGGSSAQHGASLKMHQWHRASLLLTVHKRAEGSEQEKVAPNLVCAAPRGEVGASKCVSGNDYSFPVGCCLIQGWRMKEREKKTEKQIIFPFFFFFFSWSVHLPAGLEMSLIDKGVVLLLDLISWVTSRWAAFSLMATFNWLWTAAKQTNNQYRK